MELDPLKYPIGKYVKPAEFSQDVIDKFIVEIESLPERLTKQISGLTDEQLDTRYRPEGWTIRQVVHHLADSHMNSLIRFKLAVTENSPRITAYLEDRWAELPDSLNVPVEHSLIILKGLHHRMGLLLRSLSSKDLKRTFVHPERGEVRVDETIGMYAWHSNHHLAHITQLKKQKGW